ncbi:hypothetical protein COBT_002102 [Conglomerata obtusa]
MTKIFYVLYIGPFFLLYLLYTGFIWQKKYIYLPSFEEVPFTRLNRAIIGNQNSDIYIIDNKRDIDIIIFGGSNASIVYYKYIMSRLSEYKNCNFIIPVYRGFMTSKGTSNEINYMTDAHILKKVMEKRKNKVYVFGHSLGCAVGVYFASLFNVNGIVLFNGFYDMRNVVRLKKIKRFFVFLIAEKWETYKIIANLTCKILLVVAKHDININPKNSQKLAKLCRNGSLFVSNFENHFDMDDKDSLKVICNFLIT